MPPRSDPTLPAGCVAACRGCAHRSLSAVASAAQKQEWLARALAPWAGRLQPLRTAAEAARWGYRRKVCLAAAPAPGGGWHVGTLAREAVIPLPDCPVHAPEVNAALRLLRPVLPTEDFPLKYYLQSGAQVTLVLKTARRPALDWLTPALTAALARVGVEGLWLHLFPAVGRKVLHKNGWHLLWGRPRSRDPDGLWYGPTAFQQLIPALHRQAVAEAVAFLTPRAGDAVVDLYCGSGATLRCWSEAGAAVSGVELGGEAVECAARNAPDALVLRGTCTARLPQLGAWLAGQGGQRLLFVNPPRTGLEPAVRDWIGQAMQPARIAYLSCSAGTLARDLVALEAGGYTVARLTPYDFFPHTRHVETLALACR